MSVFSSIGTFRSNTTSAYILCSKAVRIVRKMLIPRGQPDSQHKEEQLMMVDELRIPGIRV